jgi:hypothetical protein
MAIWLQVASHKLSGQTCGDPEEQRQASFAASAIRAFLNSPGMNGRDQDFRFCLQASAPIYLLSPYLSGHWFD